MWWWGPCASASCCADIPPLHATRAHVYDELRPLMVERASTCSTASTAESTRDAFALQPGMYTARHRETHELVALKVFRKRLLARRATRRRLRREVRILSMCREQPNLLTLYGVYSSRSTFEIAFELARGGEVLHRVLEPSPPLSNRNAPPLSNRNTPRYVHSEREVSRVIASVVDGLAFLHAQHVVHGEVRPEHVLYVDTEPDARVVLVDFGRAAQWPTDDITLACREHFRSRKSTTCRPTPRFLYDDPHHKRFLPPFVLQRRCATVATWLEAQQLDTFALGVTMFVLLFATFPFDCTSIDEASDGAFVPQKIQFPAGCSAAPISRAARDLLTRLLVTDPRDALTLSQIQAHPWVHDCVASPIQWTAEAIEQHRLFAAAYSADVAAHARRKRVTPVAFAYSMEERDAFGIGDNRNSSDSASSTTAEARDKFDAQPVLEDGDDDDERLSFVSTTRDAMQFTAAATGDDDDELLSADAYMRLASEEIDACTRSDDAVALSPVMTTTMTGQQTSAANDSKLWRVLTKQRRFFSFRSASSSGGSFAKSDSDA